MIVWGGGGFHNTVAGTTPRRIAWLPTSTGPNVSIRALGSPGGLDGLEDDRVWETRSMVREVCTTVDRCVDAAAPTTGPAGRVVAAVWSGTEMIVWAGSPELPKSTPAPATTRPPAAGCRLDGHDGPLGAGAPFGGLDRRRDDRLGRRSWRPVQRGSRISTPGRYDPATDSWVPNHVDRSTEPAQQSHGRVGPDAR
jgi:hypothetical protein